MIHIDDHNGEQKSQKSEEKWIICKHTALHIA